MFEMHIDRSNLKCVEEDTELLSNVRFLDD